MLERACKYCGVNKGAKGIGQHEKACTRKHAEAAQAQTLFACRQEGKMLVIFLSI
jgi:hypothetical protein